MGNGPFGSISAPKLATTAPGRSPARGTYGGQALAGTATGGSVGSPMQATWTPSGGKTAEQWFGENKAMELSDKKAAADKKSGWFRALNPFSPAGYLIDKGLGAVGAPSNLRTAVSVAGDPVGALTGTNWTTDLRESDPIINDINAAFGNGIPKPPIATSPSSTGQTQQQPSTSESAAAASSSPATAPVSPNVTEAQAIADASKKEADNYFNSYEAKALAALNSGAFGKDQAARDVLMGKGTPYEGTTAADYYLGREMSGLRGPSYSEQWFTGEGPQSLASVYDRENRKQTEALKRRMEASGKGNSGALMRGTSELGAELAAKQALQMQDAAKSADTGKMNRLGKMKDFVSDIGTERSYLGQNLSNLTAKDRTAIERGLEVKASIPKQKAETYRNVFDANTQARNLVKGAQQEDISLLGNAADKLGGVAIKSWDSSSAADRREFEDTVNMAFKRMGYTTEEAKAEVNKLTAAFGGIGPLMELLKNMSTSDKGAPSTSGKTATA